MFNDFRSRLARWMQGRYGVDALYKALIGLYLLLLVLNMIFRQPILLYLATAVVVFAFYRVFSREIARRSAENQRYLSLTSNWRKKALLIYNKFKYRKTHRYVDCPSCKTVLRLAKKEGTMTVTCPKCKNTFQISFKS